MLLFLGAFLMMVLSGFNFVMLGSLNPMLALGNPTGIEILYLLIAALILFVARKKNFSKAFMAYFSLNTLVLFVSAFLLYNKSLTEVPYLCLKGLHLWINASMLLSFVLVWGFANQNYRFKRATLEYPVLWLGFAGTLFLGGALCLNSIPVILLVCSLWSLLTLGVYQIFSKVDLGAHEGGIKVSWGYWVALIAIAFGMRFAAVFPELSFLELSNGMAFSKKLALIYSACLSLFLGAFLYFTGAKTLSKLMGLISLVIFFLGLSLFSGAGIAGYMGFIILVGAYKVLKELFLFGVDRKNRFTVKVLADVIFYSLVPTAAILTEGLTVRFAGPSKATSIYTGVFFLMIIACFIALYRSHRDLKRGLPAAKK